MRGRNGNGRGWRDRVLSEVRMMGGGRGLGRGVGAGAGRGLGRNSDGDKPGSGPGGSCVCPSCGAKIGHIVGNPCNKRKCPKCGTILTKE